MRFQSTNAVETLARPIEAILPRHEVRASCRLGSVGLVSYSSGAYRFRRGCVEPRLRAGGWDLRRKQRPNNDKCQQQPALRGRRAARCVVVRSPRLPPFGHLTPATAYRACHEQASPVPKGETSRRRRTINNSNSVHTRKGSLVDLTGIIRGLLRSNDKYARRRHGSSNCGRRFNSDRLHSILVASTQLSAQ